MNAPLYACSGDWLRHEHTHQGPCTLWNGEKYFLHAIRPIFLTPDLFSSSTPSGVEWAHQNKTRQNHGGSLWQVQEVDEEWEFDSLLQRVAIEMQEESEKIQRAMNDDNVKDDDFWSEVL